MRRRLLLLAVLVGLAVTPGTAARAETSTVGPEAEAWYAASPTCTTPIGCVPTPPLSNYPVGTMHVGVRLGLEEARTYIRLALGAVPSDATLTGGTLTIPVGGAETGTTSPETAAVVACMTFAPFASVEASTAPPPPVDCTTSSPARFTAGTPATLTVDLAPFTTRWAAGEPNDGIALVPAPETAPPATWHIAFQRGTASATIEYDALATPDQAPFVDEPSFVDEGFFGVEPLGGLSPAAPPGPAAAIVEEAQTPTQVAPVVSVLGGGFAYPAVFAVPLLLLVLGGYLGWALTRPVLAPQP